MLRVTVLTSLLAIGVQGGYYAITTWLPTFLKTVRKLSVLNTGEYLIVVIIGSFLGYIISAYLADGLGRKRTLILYAACSFVTVAAYTYLPISNSVMLVLGFPLGFFASGSSAPSGPSLPSCFPAGCAGRARDSPTMWDARSARCFPLWWAISAGRCLWDTRLPSLRFPPICW